MLEVSADIDTSLEGSFKLTAGRKGQLVGVNSWLSKLANVRNSSSDLHDPNFACKHIASPLVRSLSSSTH